MSDVENPADDRTNKRHMRGSDTCINAYPSYGNFTQEAVKTRGKGLGSIAILKRFSTRLDLRTIWTKREDEPTRYAAERTACYCRRSAEAQWLIIDVSGRDCACYSRNNDCVHNVSCSFCTSVANR